MVQKTGLEKSWYEKRVREEEEKEHLGKDKITKGSHFFKYRLVCKFISKTYIPPHDLFIGRCSFSTSRFASKIAVLI